jgi:small subunit ribosomal protein S20
MANHKSAVKRTRQNIKRRAINKGHRTRLRNQIKKLRTAMQNGEQETAQGLLIPTLSLLDRSVQKGVLHDRAAARTKSRLTRLVERPAAQA